MQMRNRTRQYFHQQDRRPWILMGGSPVIFPNEKLPNLLEASGLYLADRVDSVALQPDIPSAARSHSVNRILGRMADLRMGMETSGAWITNNGLLAAVQERLDHLPVSGIVWHVLKGQIEYDFELPKIEALATEYDVPVIRLETDYQQQDVEQLRIRLEAFAEMLGQRNQERVRIAQ
jgi:benzoyl-CoA reductase/2-hydroxyglutaryl-CoA dehydratase subunit BcrC/BadD/HgdB